MPATDVIYYREADGIVPVREWLNAIWRRDHRAAEKCLAQIGLLKLFGHELRRPIADYLRDGVYELRVRTGRAQHRILYGFKGRNRAVLVHGLTKEKRVPPKDIDLAATRIRRFGTNPTLHSYRTEFDDG